MDKLRNPCIKGKVGDFSADSDLSPPPPKKIRKLPLICILFITINHPLLPSIQECLRMLNFLLVQWSNLEYMQMNRKYNNKKLQASRRVNLSNRSLAAVSVIRNCFLPFYFEYFIMILVNIYAYNRFSISASHFSK